MLPIFRPFKVQIQRYGTTCGSVSSASSIVYGGGSPVRQVGIMSRRTNQPAVSSQKATMASVTGREGIRPIITVLRRHGEPAGLSRRAKRGGSPLNMTAVMMRIMVAWRRTCGAAVAAAVAAVALAAPVDPARDEQLLKTAQ